MKSLINKLIGKIRKGALIAAAVASLGVASCKPDPGQDPVNYIPQASLYVNPTAGNAPLESVINFDGEDGNGKQDIVEYKVDIDVGNDEIIDETIKQPSPIDITRNFANPGLVKIYGQVTDSKGAIDKKEQLVNVSNPPVDDYVDISGRLEDCENPGIERQGVVRVKNPSDNSVIGQYNVNGNFSITLDKLVSELPNGVILEVITGTASNPTSFTRIINNLPAGDINNITDLKMNPAIRPTPFYSDFDNDGYADLDKNKNGVIELSEKEDFKEHTGRVNIHDVYSLQKWNHGELPETIGHPVFKGIEISTDFTIEEQDSIEDSFRNSRYPGAGEINIVRGKNHYLELGWGFIRLSTLGEAPGTYVYEQYGADGYIERFVTNLTHLQATAKGLVNHEIAHGLLFTGHADSDTTLALFNSIIKFTSYDNRYSPPERPETFTATDIKTSYTIKDPTHTGKELEDNLLGVNF